MARGRTLDDVYRLYMNELYRYLAHLTRSPQAAEDLVQETFVRAYIHLDSYSSERVKPWLFRVAYNAFVDWSRREYRQVPFDPAGAEKPGKGEHGADPAEAALRAEQAREWSVRLQRLTAKQRHAVLLCDVHGFSYREAAEVLGLTLADLKISLYRARRKLRSIIDDENNRR